MASKKKDVVQEVIVENIHNETLEEIMGARYANYAKYVIQDRAIPDVRDGLKPVQRRIIFSMYKDGNTINHPTRKSAKTVGNVIGKYHPHGDTSVYDALVRMSQDWKVNAPLIDFQGNNGSNDGDSAAAYRYTEARLSQIAEEMIRDIDKETVDMTLTFDDTEFEPIVMPSRFPNLLVNGTQGIAVGMATEIPPHNLNEVIEAIIYRINHVRVEVSDLLNFVKGPDFPTGGLIYKTQGLIDMYNTGRGRIEIASKTEIVDDGKNKQIIITEIPYETIKINLVYELDKLRHDHVIDGISEVRDESDHSLATRIVVDIKKEANIDVIHKYLLTKTSLRSSYSSNMVAIVNGRPKTMNLLDFVDAYIDHQVEVITRRSQFDLKKSISRLEIVNGLIKAVSIVDEVVATIRASKDKKDSKLNLQKKFGFSEAQSEAIVMLQLYKLSNTDVTTFINEKNELEKTIEYLKSILDDRKKLDRLLVSDLKEIAKKYGVARRSQIIEKEETATIDKRDLIAKEEVVLAVSRDGYIKRSSVKSYKSSGENALPGLKAGDTLVYAANAMSTDYLLCFTSLGYYLFIPVHEINENKWKDEGKHINYLVSLNPNEKIVRAFVVEKFRDDLFIALVTKYGQIKRLPLSLFPVGRYNRPIMCMKLLSGDEVSDVTYTDGDSNLVLFTSDGRASMFNENGLPNASLKSGGVKGFSQLKGDSVVALLSYLKEDTKGKTLLVTDHGCTRILDISNINLTQRLGKVSTVFRSFKTDPHNLVYVRKIDTRTPFMHIRALTNLREIFEFDVDDYHVTPLDRYAKQNLKLNKRSTIEVVFDENKARIDKKMVSHYVPVVKETFANDSSSNNDSSSSFENDSKQDNHEEEKGYTQISIFDEDIDE